MRRYKAEELKVGQIYENGQGFWKYQEPRGYNLYTFKECVPSEDDDDEFIESESESYFTKNELNFE